MRNLNFFWWDPKIPWKSYKFIECFPYLAPGVVPAPARGAGPGLDVLDGVGGVAELGDAAQRARHLAGLVHLGREDVRSVP